MIREIWYKLARLVRFDIKFILNGHLLNFFNTMMVKIILIVILGFMPLGFYCYKFGGVNSHLSDNPEHWAFFGDYIGGVYSVILTCILTYLTFYLQKKGSISKSRKEVIRELFSRVNQLNRTNKLRIKDLNSFTNFIIDSEILFQNEEEYKVFIIISDYYKAVSTNGCRNPDKELLIKNKIIKMYNEYDNNYS